MKAKLFLLFLQLVIIISCSNLNTKIEGKYKKVEGNGTVFENSLIEIQKINENTYLVEGYNSSHKLEWHADAQKVNNQKITWTDKYLPCEISFDGENAELLFGGNGTFGRFILQRYD